MKERGLDKAFRAVRLVHEDVIPDVHHCFGESKAGQDRPFCGIQHLDHGVLDITPVQLVQAQHSSKDFLGPFPVRRRHEDHGPETGIGIIGAAQLLEAENVWSRGQLVHIVLLGEGHGASEVLDLAPELQERIDTRFRQYTLSRMFTSGRNTALADSLEAQAGFRMVLPEVYRYSTQDQVYRFRNDNPMPSERIREIGVTWQSPIPDSLPTLDELIEWRNAFAEANYHDPQLADTAAANLRSIEVAGEPALEFQSSWSSPADAWPAGGPFITRVIPCPDQDRLYFADAWLYAPGQDKYEYMIQLRTILDSFQCGGG